MIRRIYRKLHGKNDFAEVSKTLAKTENNYVRPSK